MKLEKILPRYLLDEEVVSIMYSSQRNAAASLLGIR